MNIYAFSRSFAAASALLGLPMLAQALNYGPLEIVGFGKDEFSSCDNCSMGLVNPSSFDPRGVLNPPNPMVNQSSTSGRRSSNLALAQLTGAVGVNALLHTSVHGVRKILLTGETADDGSITEFAGRIALAEATWHELLGLVAASPGR